MVLLLMMELGHQPVPVIDMVVVDQLVAVHQVMVRLLVRGIYRFFFNQLVVLMVALVHLLSKLIL